MRYSQILAEDVALVGRDHHVVLGCRLGEDRHLALHLDMAGIGAARPFDVLVDALLDDLGTELGGGTLDRVGVGHVGRSLAADQEPARPALPDQVLGERVGLHRPRGRDVEQGRGAAVQAQRVVGRTAVEEDGTRLLRRGNKRQQVLGPEIGDEQPLAGSDPLREGRTHIATLRHQPLHQLELLLQEAAGRLVVGDPQASALDALVREHGLHQRERDRRRLGLAEIGHGHADRIGACRQRSSREQKRQGAAGNENDPAHGAVPEAPRRAWLARNGEASNHTELSVLLLVPMGR